LSVLSRRRWSGMPTCTGELTGIPRFPAPGVVERDFLLAPGATVALAGVVLPFKNLLLTVDYTQGSHYWDVWNYWLPDDPQAWVRLLGDPKTFGPSEAAALLNAVKAVTFAPASEALVRDLAARGGKALQAAKQAIPNIWDKVSGHLVWLDRLRTVNFLRMHGARASDAAELVRHQPPGLVWRLQADPYHLAGLPRARFGVLDGIASAVGYVNPPRRRMAYVLCEIADAIYGSGHTRVRRALLEKKLASAFRLSPQQAQQEVQGVLLAGAASKLLMVSPSGLTVTYDDLYWAEWHAAQRVKALWSAVPAGSRVPAHVRAAAAARHNLDRFQRQALDTALDRGISVVTGGPGCGKTHTIAALVDACRAAGLRVEVAATTGKAARNLARHGITAATVHKLLGLRPKAHGLECPYRHHSNPFPCDVLIVDESSMLDAYVFEHIVYSVADGTNVVLVGDADQLPPVGPGHPFADTLREMRAAGKGYAVLRQNHRQGPGSAIPGIAAHILAGTLTPQHLLNCPDVTVHTVPPGVTPQQLGRALAAIVQGLAKNGHSVLVLHPLRDEVDRLNRVIQGAVNPGRGRAASWPFRVGDPVIQNVNEYEAPLAGGQGVAAVMNGEVGTVVSARPDAFGNLGTVEVDFGPGRLVEYSGPAIDASLALAYVLTVHKCQGSEADVAVVVILSNMRMPPVGRQRRGSFAWNRPLLYTAFTRARRHVVVVTDDPAAAAAAARRGGPRRWTRYGGWVSGVFV